MASWFPMSAWTAPPAAAACVSSFISRSMALRDSPPRSSTSPVCTRWVLAPAQSPLASMTSAARSTFTNWP